MNTTIKRRLLIAIIGLLIVINISALVTIYYNSTIKSKQPVKENDLQEQVEIRGMNIFFKDQLKLDNEQFSLFQEINNENMIKSRELVQEMNNLRFEMMNEISEKNPDMEKLDRIAKEIGNLHYELKLNTINHFIQLKEICNDDQQQVLQEMFIRMIQNQDRNQENMGRRNQHGKRRNNRPSHGKR